MQNIDIQFYDRILTSPIWYEIPKAITELVEKGFMQSRGEYPHADSAALIAMDIQTNKPVGFIVYKVNSADEYYIYLSYVAPDHRGNGIHGELFKMLVHRAKINNLRSIVSSTDVKNVSAQRAFEKQGRKLIAYTYEYVITDYEEPRDPTLKLV